MAKQAIPTSKIVKLTPNCYIYAQVQRQSDHTILATVVKPEETMIATETFLNDFLEKHSFGYHLIQVPEFCMLSGVAVMGLLSFLNPAFNHHPIRQLSLSIEDFAIMSTPGEMSRHKLKYFAGRAVEVYFCFSTCSAVSDDILKKSLPSLMAMSAASLPSVASLSLSSVQQPHHIVLPQKRSVKSNTARQSQDNRYAGSPNVRCCNVHSRKN
ncbi:hypothetical protein GQX74_001730 [Glossina fuscipes]|nr:hypothetical protein GQX74_001730 [Glossina fuscipes]